MGTNTFSIVGDSSVQSDDAEITSVDELSTSSNKVNGLTLPYNIVLTDMLTTSSLVQNHQFSIWVNGKKQTSNYYSAMLNPQNPARFRIASQSYVIPAGSLLQIRTAQLTEPTTAAAETGKVTLVYSRV